MSDEDLFYAIGFTAEDILAGKQLRTLSLRAKHFETMRELHSEFGPLVEAVKTGRVSYQLAEVYFLSPYQAEDYSLYTELFGRHLSIEFFNKAAFDLCQHHNIELPPVLTTLRRDEIPRGFGVSMQFRSYARLQRAANG